MDWSRSALRAYELLIEADQRAFCKIRISDVTCRCGAVYERAESELYKRLTRADMYRCVCCGVKLEAHDPRGLLAYRLVCETVSAAKAGAGLSKQRA